MIEEKNAWFLYFYEYDISGYARKHSHRHKTKCADDNGHVSLMTLYLLGRRINERNKFYMKKNKE